MESLFKKYIQSVISPQEFGRFRDFVGNDKNTESISKFMKEEWMNHLNSKEDILKNPVLFQKIQQRILTGEFKKSSQKLKLYTQFIRIAAIIIIGLVLTGVWFWQQNNATNNQIRTQTVSIPHGAKTQFQLPDGSSVWLNSGSSLTYSGDFSRHRQVELVGEAFFDVVKSKSPFTVETTSGNIEVLGTAFNVQAYEDGEFATTLERGVVKVINRINNDKILMKPGEQIQLIDEKLVKSNVDTKLFTSWKDGRLIFSRDPFPNIMKRLERWFNVTIEYSADDFDGLWFSGTIEGETLTEVMNMICKVAPVKYNYNSQKRTVIIESEIN